MPEPILYEGHWWYQHENGAWSRWDEAASQWMPYLPTSRAPLFSSISNLGRWVVRVVALDMLIAVILGIIGVNLLATSNRFASSDPEQIFEGFFAQMTLFNLLSVFWYVTAIVFLIWFYRAYQNMAALGVYARWSSGWAIGAWLIPILNLFRPKQMADDIWRSSDPTLPENPGHLWLSGKVAPLLHYWWAAWILSSFAPLLTMPFMFAGLDVNASPGPFFARFFGMFIATVGLGRLVAGAFAIPVVRQMTARQEYRAQKLGAPRGP
ncbi:MAG: DUF4328 domain-containing protein [Actinomycetota bacterium]